MPLDDPSDLLLDAPKLVRQLYGARAGSRDQEGNAQLSAIDLQVLIALSEDPDQKVEDLADRLAVKVSTISHAITALKAEKLIKDEPGAGHHRRRTRPLTAKGQKAKAALVAKARKLLDEHNKPQG